MKHVRREELCDWITWTERRPQELPAILAQKAARRVHLGPELTLLFENAATVRYQVQEMMRVEHIVREADIQHELETYNELLGGPGELGCTLLIEIDDPRRREEVLPRWLDLPRRIYVALEGGERVHALVDERQIGDTRVSAVQYLRFPTRGRPPVAIGTDFAELAIESALTPAQRAALAEDLAS
ncbi:MAG: DUF3501 family protein [Planctomycetes bacterium]|nr:DUF3501 family protein [Planctomycetota bacterium]